MSFKSNVGISAREFVFSEGGNDDLSGQTEETATATINACVDLVNALIPAPSITEESAINSTGAGTFTENIIIPDGCSFYATGVTNDALAGNAFELASFSAVELVSASTIASSASVFIIQNKTDSDLKLVDCICGGDNSIGIEVSGASSDIDLNINRIRLNADNCRGISNATTAAGVPDSYAVSNILLDGDDCTGISYAPIDTDTHTTLICGHIGSTGTQTGTIGLDILSGEFRATVNHIEASIAIGVSGGAVLDLSCRFVSGNIIVDSGGTLNCDIAQFTGTITNNGTIIGRIGTENFGVSSDEQIVEVSADYDILTSDDIVIGTGPLTATLPLLSTANKQVIVRSEIASGIVTVDGTSGETIDGDLNKFIRPGASITFSPSTSDWQVLSDNVAVDQAAGEVLQSDGAGNLKSGSAFVDATTNEWSFDESINVPSGSVKVGETLSISEGGSDLVVGNLLVDQMSFSVNSEFSESTGSAAPTYIDFGVSFTENIQLIDTTVITTNPLSFSLIESVVSPDLRLTDSVTFRANGVMTNVTMSIVDNTTGLALRYIPSKAAFEGREDGLTLLAGDSTFFFASNDADTATTFHFGFVPFVTSENQQLDFIVKGDNIDLLGNVSEVPYQTAEVHDGPPVELLTSIETFLEGSVIFADAGGALSQDNTNFFWNDTTNTLRIADELSLSHDGTDSNIVNALGDLFITNEDATGAICNVLGSETTGTEFQVVDSAGAKLFKVNGLGAVTFNDDLLSITNGGSIQMAAGRNILWDGGKLQIRHGGSNGFIENTTGDLRTSNSATTSKLIYQIGTDTSATAFEVQNSSAAALFVVTGDGVVNAVGDLALDSDIIHQNIAPAGTQSEIWLDDTNLIERFRIQHTDSGFGVMEMIGTSQLNFVNTDGSQWEFSMSGGQDENPFFEWFQQGTNGADVEIFITSRDPVNFTGITGSLALKADGTDSQLYVNQSAVDGNAWAKLVTESEIHATSRLGFAVTTNTAALGEAWIYACTDSSDARTLTISTSTIALGSTSSVFQFTVKDEFGGAGSAFITIDTEGAQTIDGLSSVQIKANYGDVTLYSDGSNLFTVGE